VGLLFPLSRAIPSRLRDAADRAFTPALSW
jgi:hypothetical protein